MYKMTAWLFLNFIKLTFFLLKKQKRSPHRVGRWSLAPTMPFNPPSSSPILLPRQDAPLNFDLLLSAISLVSGRGGVAPRPQTLRVSCWFSLLIIRRRISKACLDNTSIEGQSRAEGGLRTHACEIRKERLNSLFNTVPLNFSWAHTHRHMLGDSILLFPLIGHKTSSGFLLFILSVSFISKKSHLPDGHNPLQDNAKHTKTQRQTTPPAHLSPSLTETKQKPSNGITA